jgi:hypothetical protein
MNVVVTAVPVASIMITTRDGAAMSIIRLGEFGGIAPAIDDRKLPDRMAQVAENIWFDGDSIYPMPADMGASSLGLNEIQIGAGRVNKLFYHRRREDGTPHIYVLRGNEFGIAAGQINSDIWDRVYFTRWTGSPTTSFLHVISRSTPDASGENPGIRRAGVPNPTAKPTVTVDELPVLQVTAVTNGAPPTLTTSAPHGLSDGNIVSVTVTNAAGSTNLSELSGREFYVNAPSANTIVLRGANTSAAQPFNPAVTTIAIRRQLGADEIEERAYVFTVVNAYGEEGGPSPVSDVVAVPDGSKALVKIVGMENDPQFVTQTRIRLYRAVTGLSTATRFLFVKEHSGISPNAIIIEDDVTDAALGEQMSAEGWKLPPIGLRGLIAMPNGFMAGFVGNTVHMSEPYQPHAWPYSRTVAGNIVALGSFDHTIVVATETDVYTGSGVDPSSITLQRAPIDAPCINPNMMISAGNGVIYPSPYGLTMISSRGEQHLTAGIFTKKQWGDLVGRGDGQGLDSAVFWDGKYIAFSGSSDRHYVFDLSVSPVRVSTFTTSGLSAGAACAWPPTGNLLATLYSGGFSTIVALFASPSQNREGRWMSKTFSVNGHPNFAVGQVLADFGEPSGVVRTNTDIVSLRLYPTSRNLAAGSNYGRWAGERHAALETIALGSAAGDLQGSVVVPVSSPDPFRLPGIASAREWTIELRLAPRCGRVSGAIVAESVEELKEF